jgi:4-hydroxy-tetrahydrodipicolinate reductase
MSRRPLRVVALGLGPIGRSVCQEIAASDDLELAGAVDPSPALAGKDLGRLLGIRSLSGRRVAASLDGLSPRKVDVAAHLAASRFAVARVHLRELVERKLPVVTTCEEMIAARWRWPAEASALDRAARRAGIPVLTTGVNPGFVMDLLPAALANVCIRVHRVHVTRWVDTSTRRLALQEKTGVGLRPAEFRRRAKEGRVGHVGLRDSLIFLMNHLPLEGIVGEETLRPIVAAKTRKRGRSTLRRGEVSGVHQTVVARDPASRRVVASFDLRMEYGLAGAHDEIRIDGDPAFRARIEGGVPGDRATVGAVLSAIRYAPDASPGLGV